MDYEKLKEVIAKQIKENGRREITGPVLQAVLMAMVDSLGEVYPHTYTEEQKAQARANIDALSDHNGEITKEKLSAEVQAILEDVPNKQNISDATLATQAKTIVGAINELTNKKGLLFLGVLGPNDPAPSNEPTKGYYLSFQASTKDTPYFNGVHLHRYSMLIWTQDKTGRWKFKRVKYEDRRPAPAVVVGRKIPIIAYKDGHYKLRLGSDGTRLSYRFFGSTNLRIENGYPYSGANRPMGYNEPCANLSNIVHNFPLEDNGRVFQNKDQVVEYLNSLSTNDPGYPLSTKNYSRISGDIVWTPQHWKRQAVFVRRYHGMGGFNPQSEYGSRKIPIRVKMVSKHYMVTPLRPLVAAIEMARSSTPDLPGYGMLYAAKRLSVKAKGKLQHVHACGYSYNSKPFGYTNGRFIRVNVNI